jgi:hypothetical protein
LLPATINTGDTPYITPRNPAERLAQYRQSLQQWIDSRLGVPIVFVENSGADLRPLQMVADESGYAPGVEVIGFADNEMAEAKGKGQGEIRTFEYALERSSVLRDAQLIWKVTGRYFVRNGRRLLACTTGGEWHALHFDLLANLTFADTRCFFAPPQFISDFLVPRRDEVDDLGGVYLEHCVARAIHMAMSQGWDWEPLGVSPDLQGVSGTSGKTYDRSPIRRTADSGRRRLFRAMLERG